MSSVRVKVSVRFMVSFSHSHVQKTADPHFTRSRQFTIRDVDFNASQLTKNPICDVVNVISGTNYTSKWFSGTITTNVQTKPPSMNM